MHKLEILLMSCLSQTIKNYNNTKECHSFANKFCNMRYFKIECVCLKIGQKNILIDGNLVLQQLFTQKRMK